MNALVPAFQAWHSADTLLFGIGRSAMSSREKPTAAPNPMGREHFTITEKQAKQRQDGSWYMETVKTERSKL
jgi:hypothetical protein